MYDDMPYDPVKVKEVRNLWKWPILKSTFFAGMNFIKKTNGELW